MIRPPTPPATHLKVVASSEQHKKAKGPPGSIVFRPLLLPLMAQEAPVFDPTMSEQKPTLQQPGSCTQKIPDVYKCLGIADPSISDGDVVVAFHKAYSVQRDSPGGDVSETVNALNAIAGSRGSQWLAFTRMILPHLTEANVSVLSSRRMSTPNFQSSVDVNNQQSGNASTVHETKDPTTAISCEPFIFRAAADPPPPTEFTLSAKPTWPKATKSPRASRAHDFDSDGSIDWAVSVTASNYSEDLSSGASSSDRDSVLSQLSEIEGGKLWNGQYWCCAVCNEELDDEGKCFEDHTTDPCGYCGKDFEMRDCSKYCVECHLELPEPCPHCNADEEGEEAPMEMIWDDTDGIWRCTTCMWEVEASREDEGHCQCFVDPEESIIPEDNEKTGDSQTASHEPVPATIPVRRIELLYYPEYEPADSDSSGEESDDEPHSEDEWFIDDGPLESAIAPTAETPETSAAADVTKDDSITIGGEVQSTGADTLQAS